MADGDSGVADSPYPDRTIETTPTQEMAAGELEDGFDEGAPDDEEMPLTEHIEEMVRRLGVVVAVMAVVSGIVFPFADRIVKIGRAHV